MGDCSACEFAQASHLGVSLAGDAIYPDKLLVYGCPVSRGLLSIGLVIDDLVFLEQVLCHTPGHPLRTSFIFWAHQDGSGFRGL